MKNYFETYQHPEQKDRSSQVLLHFFRHAEPERDPSKPNAAFELTKEGQRQAVEKGKAVGPKNIKQSVAFGSPRKRAQHTSGLVMASELLEIENTPSSLESLKEGLNSGLKVGEKIGVEPKLNFYLDPNTPFGKKASEAIFTNKNYLKFLVEESDTLADELNDRMASTYSRQASDTAEIVKKYLSVSFQWDKLVKAGKYEDVKLERFLGSHGGVTESFLLKVIEKTKGPHERNRLVQIMPNQFEYTEGFEVSINQEGPKQTLHIAFRKENKDNPEQNFIFDEDVPLKILDEVINERK
jgi:hypothetical protein